MENKELEKETAGMPQDETTDRTGAESGAGIGNEAGNGAGTGDEAGTGDRTGTADESGTGDRAGAADESRTEAGDETGAGTAEEDRKEAASEESESGSVGAGGSKEAEDSAGGASKKAAENAGSEKSEKSEKRGFFGRKKDPRDTQIEELTDRLRRTMAEFDNFRKRTEKEKASMYEIGARDIIEKILPVVDNLERGLAAVPEDVKGTPFAEGMEKIYKQMVKTLDDLDVKPIEAVGKEFDPNLHNAVMHVDDESLGENVVAAELQKGYTYRGTVVRHSMVQVAN